MQKRFVKYEKNRLMTQLPILNYHGIEAREREYPWLHPEKPYVISRTSFEKQLDFLLEHGFKTLTLCELEDWFEGSVTYEKPVIVTFDDAHISQYEHVVDLFERKNLKAVFFVPVGLIGQPGHMTWDQLKNLVVKGFEVGSHGVKHIPLSNLTHHELWKELDQSKKALEKELGIHVTSFSVPRGFYQLRIREVAMELGYKFLFTSRFDVNYAGQDPWRLNRIAVKRNLSLKDFNRFVQGDLGYKRIVEQAKEGLRRVVHPSIYDALADFKRVLYHG